MQLKYLPLLSIIIIFHTTPTLASLQEYRASLVSTAQQTDDRELASKRVAFEVDTTTADRQPMLLQRTNKQPRAHIKTVAAPLSSDDQTAMLMRENAQLRALVATLQQRLAVQAGL